MGAELLCEPGNSGGGMVLLGSLRRNTLGLALALMVCLTPLAVSADDHDPRRSGHPLRVAAYIFHPVGVLLDTLIFRPAHWVVSHEPLTTLFGHDAEG